ncbi:MAG: AsmA family protein [Acaryochloris sp. RU_4_1]|nr:AsmA family protein [Acaryochloris sp. RU_4_1]NJR53521.1 AsmA family protein [Acaryochloris sp. CRU_2_0]
MAKRWLKIVGGGVAIALFALGATWLSRNAILDSVLEGAIKDTTGVSAEIEGLDFQPFAGDLRIQTLTLKNPQGFSTPHLIKIQKFDLKFQLSNLWQDPVEIESLTVNGIDLNVEQQIPNNNLATVVETLQSDPPANTSKEKVVKIGRLSIRNIKALIQVNAIGDLGLEENLNLGEIDLTNVTSTNAEGKLSVAIANAVITALLQKISQQDLPFKLDGENPTQDLPIDIEELIP